MKERLIVNKYRPKTLDDIILLPRIRKIFESGVHQSYIFYGHYGVGKSSLAKIICGQYSKDKPYIELNASLHTSIDTLRNEIDTFCANVYIPFDLEGSYNLNEDYKYVYLDEYEKTSKAGQEAFKAYIEKYENTVRFILTSNNVNKIDPGIRSRLVGVNFDPMDNTERSYLMNAYYKKIKDEILPAENITMDKETIQGLVRRNFPDYRSMLKELDNYKITGSLTGSIMNVDAGVKKDLFERIITQPGVTYDDIYHFLMDYVGSDNMHVLFNMLGKEFVQWVMSSGHDTNKLFQSNYIVSNYHHILETQTDPIILGMTVIGKFREIWAM